MMHENSMCVKVHCNNGMVLFAEICPACFQYELKFPARKKNVSGGGGGVANLLTGHYFCGDF